MKVDSSAHIKNGVGRICCLLVVVASAGMAAYNHGRHNVSINENDAPRKLNRALNENPHVSEAESTSPRKLNRALKNLRKYTLPAVEEPANTSKNSFQSAVCFHLDPPMFSYVWNISTQVFPECHKKSITYDESNLQLATDSSLLFLSWSGETMHHLRRSNVRAEDFPGKVVWFLTEAVENQWTSKSWRSQGDHVRWYGLGHMRTSGSAMFFPLLAQRVAALDVEDRKMLFVPNRKPRNTGKYFLIYISSHRVNHREGAFNRLASIDEVHWGGACKGGRMTNWKLWMFCDSAEVNARPQVKQAPFLNGTRTRNTGRYAAFRKGHDNRVIYNDYRFALVMENRPSYGYMTEKILYAFLGGSIPIWFGTDMIFDVINKDAFIFYDFRDPEPALRRIRYLENNRTAYEEMLSQPILADGERTIEKYFSVSDDFGAATMKRKIRQLVGVDSEAQPYDQSPVRRQATL